ncbi:MAG: hypothetical protein ACOYB4_03340 [Methyloceanibacter sp.]
MSFLQPPGLAPAFAQEACRCKGCGCKGGPGWRGPNGYCVSTARLAQICGSPPGEPCKQEAAALACHGDETAGLESKAKTQAQ